MQWYSPEFNAFCLKLESKLTSLRKAVLFVLWQAKQPLKPYEILSYLHDIEQKSHAAAVYRVLDYLCQIGIVPIYGEDIGFAGKPGIFGLLGNQNPKMNEVDVGKLFRI